MTDLKRLNVLATLMIIALSAVSQHRATKIEIDFQQKGARVEPSMYGIFFEEINNAGDGGLYSEMLRNRSFEDHVAPGGTVVRDNKYFCPATPSYITGKIKAQSAGWNSDSLQRWTIKVSPHSKAAVSVKTNNPLNSNSPHYAEFDIQQASGNAPVSFINSGYWGISVVKGEKYNLRFFANISSRYKGTITALVRSDSGKVIANRVIQIKNTNGWKEYKCQLTALQTHHQGTFELQFDSPGLVMLDFISLSPAKTYKNHEGGFRADVSKMLTDLKPAFFRWPGGCVVEGATLENRIRWKETLGDPSQRRGEYMKWGYRNTYGFGYHEFLQYCEEMNMQGMYVANVGLSCEYSNGDFCRDDSVEFFIQDALDAIEYAIGDVSTFWGAKRAAAGHPRPFPLKYVEIGNENHGPMYEKRYNTFYSRLKKAYPQLEMIFNGVASGAGSIEVLNPKFEVDKIEIADYHWYDGPDWFYNHTFLFDRIQPRHNFRIYVGEYACNRKVGSGNLFGALSEAAFIMGMERNSDLVTMTSYAPLIENSNGRKWPVNMMMLNNHQVVGRSSYYVQKMFAENRPSFNLSTHLLNAQGMAIDTLTGMRQYAQAGYNEPTREIIIKVVNATSEAYSPQIALLNSPKMLTKGEVITLSANDPTAENSFDEPQKVAPKTFQIKNVSDQFQIRLEPWSFTVLKVKCMR